MCPEGNASLYRGSNQTEFCATALLSNDPTDCCWVTSQLLLCAVQVYAGPLCGGSRAVVLFNRHTIGTQYPISNITVTWRQIGFASDVKATVRDLHAEKDLGTFTNWFTGEVDIHDARMLRVVPHHVKPKYDDWRPWAGKNFAEQRDISLRFPSIPSRHVVSPSFSARQAVSS